MTELVVYQGDMDYELEIPESERYLYRIGGGNVDGDFVSINDWELLNHYALLLRDEYTEWVYSYNNLFKEHGLLDDDFSVFFLGDFSCKRTELFSTFSSICNLSVVKEKTKNVQVTKARLIGVTNSFVLAFKSVFTDVELVGENIQKEKISAWKMVLLDLKYISEIFVIIFINRIFNFKSVLRDNIMNRAFFSSFPLMYTKDNVEIKYQDFVKDNDAEIVCIVTDGFHQHVTISEYIHARFKLKNNNKFSVIDDCLRMSDVFHSLQWLYKLTSFRRKVNNKKHYFNNIDISLFVKSEWIFSFSRITRLMLLKGTFTRYFKNFHLDEVIYYLHEFPYGRLLTSVIGECCPNVRRIGFQHGPASVRKLFYFMGDEEATTLTSYIDHAPIPDRVLAEDEDSKEIYEKAGYKNVKVMDEIYRLSYLDAIKINRDNSVLIALGMHDAKPMLNVLLPLIKKNNSIHYVIKPHPRANNDFLENINIDNVEISNKRIDELLSKACKVYVTYSSVGIEAKYLGTDVVIVNIPGIINESPLLQCNG
jgi:hypothetical protein